MHVLQFVAMYVLFILYLVVKNSMKRSMSQSTMCLQCFESVHKGWPMLHHKRSCKGKPDNNNFTQSMATQQCEVDDLNNQEEEDTLHPKHDEGPLSNVCIVQPAILPEAHTPILWHVTPILPRMYSLTSTTREILEFLATAEKGEGTSRGQAQAWLDYHHAKGAPSARLMPKDIRTCWKHVSKVAC
jgi:hypothetical protein